MDRSLPQEFLDHAAEARVSPPVKLGMNRAALKWLAQFPVEERPAVLRAWREQLQAADGGKQRFPLALAEAVGADLAEQLRPACARIEIAGSVRRRKPDVKDIELLCVPRLAAVGKQPDSLDAAAKRLIAAGLLALRPSVKGITTYGPKNKLLTHVPSGLGVDVFTADARNFGMAFVVRTGPAEFNVRMMSRFQKLGMRGHAYGGVTGVGGVEIECPDEETVFGLLGWRWTPPEERR